MIDQSLTAGLDEERPARAIRRTSRAAVVRPVAERAAGIAAIVVLWQVAAWLAPASVASPLQVALHAVTNMLGSPYLAGLGLKGGGYLPHLVHTAQTVLIGVTLGGALGVVTGLLAGEVGSFARAVAPIYAGLGTVPIIVSAPFLMLWFGIVPLSQIILVAFYSCVVLHISAYQAIATLPDVYRDFAACLGGGRLDRFAAVDLPGALPQIFGGLRIASGSAWGLACAAELLGAQAGVGRVIQAFAAVYDIAGLMTIVLLAGLFALAFDALISVARGRALRWQRVAAQP